MFLKGTKLPDIITAVKDFLRIYNAGGIIVQSIDCDNGFRSAKNALMDDCKIQQVNFSNPSEHEPHSERNNRVIQERVRAEFQGLPYASLPKPAWICLVMEAAKKLNYFPAKNGL